MHDPDHQITVFFDTADGAVVCCSGELDLGNVGRLREAIDAALEAASCWIDLREVTFLDSSAIHLLLRAQRTALRHSTCLLIAPTSPDTARAVGSGSGSTLFTWPGIASAAWSARAPTGTASAARRPSSWPPTVASSSSSEALPEGGYRVFGLFGDAAQKASVTGADGSTQAVALSGSGAGLWSSRALRHRSR